MSTELIIYIVGIFVFYLVCGIFYDVIEKNNLEPIMAFGLLWFVIVIVAVVGGVFGGIFLLGVETRKLFER